MHKCGIADYADSLLSVAGTASLVEAVKSGYGCAHADGCVKGVEGLGSAESIAADIAENVQAELFKNIVNASVGAAGAHYGRTAGNCAVIGNRLGKSLTKLLGNIIDGEFSKGREELLALA
jgi:hypothetical protein